MSSTDPALRYTELSNQQIFTLLTSGEQPAAGQCLTALREQRNWTQQELGDRIGLDRSTIATWENGRRWASQESLDKLLLVLTGTVSLQDTLVATEEIDALLATLEKAGKEVPEIADSLLQYATPKVVKSLILKSSGPRADARCMQLFFQIRKEMGDEKRLLGQNDARNVTPQQSAWNAGEGVYAQAPKVEKAPADPEDEYSQACINMHSGPSNEAKSE